MIGYYPSGGYRRTECESDFRWLESPKHIWIARKCGRLRRAEAMLAGGGLHVASAKDRSPPVADLEPRVANHFRAYAASRPRPLALRRRNRLVRFQLSRAEDRRTETKTLSRALADSLGHRLLSHECLPP
jgi:hypothetical protein